MKLLAFESSAKAAGTALLSDGCLLAEYMQNSGQTHSRTLMELAKNMLSGCDLTPQDIDAVAVAAGPGSFTGVRIGMARSGRFSSFNVSKTSFAPSPTRYTGPGIFFSSCDSSEIAIARSSVRRRSAPSVQLNSAL